MTPEHYVSSKGVAAFPLELSTKNAKEFMLQALKQEALKNPEEKKNIGVEMLKRDLHLDKNSPSLKIIMQLRDEAHRFGITFHRSLRLKRQTKSELKEIKGIGDATSKKLLQHFKSVERIKKASEAELAAVIGKAAAKKVFLHFSS